MGKAIDLAAELERRRGQGAVAGGSNVDFDDDEELQDDGTFVECGCCFGMLPPDRMTTCPDKHLFCRGCLRRYAAVELGSRNCALKCLHMSNCAAHFHESELLRLLPGKLFFLYERLKQQRDLRERVVEGLEVCPFCDWGCSFGVSKEVDARFRCGNAEECGVDSCRLCRKKAHAPKTCKEVEEDEHLVGRVAIEEAMTRAMTRACPKCSQVFIKSEGCNKVTCPMCQTSSCYVCRQAIGGYDHFHRNDPNNAADAIPNDKCPLYDLSVDQRHEQEVNEAYARALEQYRRDHPDVEVGGNLRINAPEAPVIAGN